MPDSFFANSKPRKRKRDASSSSATTGGRAGGGAGDIRPSKAPRKLGTSRKANGVDSSAGPSRPGRPGSSGPGSYGTGTHSMSKNRKRALDEELSDASDTNGGGDGTGMGAVDDMDLRQSSPSVNSADEDEYVDETPAEKRLRLAKLYLQGVEDEVRERDVGGWDAKDIDRDIIQERLKKDVAQQAGKVHLFLADTVCDT
jgi:ribosomal RNA-processing protein 9